MTKGYYYEMEDYDGEEKFMICGIVSGELNEIMNELSEFSGHNFYSIKIVPLEEGPIMFENEEVIKAFKEMCY